MNTFRIGLDIGSTTAKMVVLNHSGEEIVFDAYQRHHTKVKECLSEFLQQLSDKLGDVPLSVCITGSVGMGIAERYSIPFVQEVVAASRYLEMNSRNVATLIDIGGEDAKMVFLTHGQTTDLRMNGNCAGGTGAFIDQMAILLGVSVSELGALAEKATQIYPIASRCGVFCKTDIQNLIARNVPKEDIAASIFHAVTVQTIVTLAHGHDISTPILFCGGPLTFIPALRTAFADYLQLPPESFILPEKANLIPAWGTALSADSFTITPSRFIRLLDTSSPSSETMKGTSHLEPIFDSVAHYEEWKSEMSLPTVGITPLTSGTVQAVIGIDSGSTTTKIVVLDRQGRMLYSYYHDNNGNPVKAVEDGLRKLLHQCQQHGTNLQIIGSCSTGYGEELIKAAFHMDAGIIETMSHYMAARHINPKVSFILDIGGQDMKAIFVENGIINRIEVNEACSSGCGSFISTFARSLNCTVGEFSTAACLAPSPCDLGTRCTVFMNSKVKQVLREGASIADIAAGLSYSVVKNCLFKVLRLRDTDSLGENIIVQGGTMRNDSIVRSLERLTGKKVFRSDCPELMGALGCALYAAQIAGDTTALLEEMVAKAEYTSTQLLCHGCENQCTVTRYRFGNNNTYFSGNRCEKVFNNKGEKEEKGINAYDKKRALLFDREVHLSRPLLTIGIPRCLNMYEEYPFWHTLFTSCNIQVSLSGVSNFSKYEHCASKVMSDNICFPAKLVHSHIDHLLNQKVDRIFMPFVVFEKTDKQMQNSYNCPIVSGYSYVVRSVQSGDTPIDTPTVSFKDASALYNQCREYLTAIGVKSSTIRTAFRQAQEAQKQFEDEIANYNETLFAEAKRKGKLVILLAGRPYHSDSLIQHKVSDMIASLGAYVLTDDVVRNRSIALTDVQYLSQWAFTNRILKSARWVADQGEDVQYMQLTSFGCGPDAFLTDEVQALLKRYGKNLTLLKIDDVNNIGSLKLRVRSLIESLHIGLQSRQGQYAGIPSLPVYTSEAAKKKMIIPFFTPFISPLIPPLMKLAGIDADNLPISDSDSSDWGLKYSNNEVCYPATLIVGDIVKAFRNGTYNPDTTCVAITQTGGQCRASNYLSLIRKSLIDNGYTNTPLVSIAFGSGIDNYQPGFKVNWIKILPIILASVLYSDSIAKFYYAAVIRENKPGEAKRLRDLYLKTAQAVIQRNRPDELYDYLALAAKDFNQICRSEEHPKVGIVGEIFLKFHPFAQKHVTDWLVEQKIEVVFPMLIDFFMQSFVNMKENKKSHLEKRPIPDFAINWLYKKAQKQLDKVNAIAAKFRYFTPFDNIFEKAELARPIISLNAQFGEGWLIAGEMSTLASQGITHIVSLQPFGCIANHIVEKGIENKIKSMYTQLNILSLDFDSSVSNVNITNRLLLFINNITSNNHERYRK